MRYDGNLYRPPSEAYSLLIQVTLGCSHNTCTFCSMFRDKVFTIRDTADVLEDLESARKMYRYVERIFLCDGDALCLPNDKLMPVLDKIHELFPECKRVNVYGNSIDVGLKTPAELRQLHENGVQTVYLGAESGSDKVLKAIHKGSTRAEIIEAVHKLEESGIAASVTLISGLAGKEGWKDHAVQTGTLITEMNASYAALLTLSIRRDAPMRKLVERGELTLLTPEEVMEETYLLLQHADPKGPTIFRSNHASNYYSLKGTLPNDKEALLATIDMVRKNRKLLKPEWYRELTNG